MTMTNPASDTVAYRRQVREWKEEAVESLGRPLPATRHPRHVRELTDQRDRKIAHLTDAVLAALDLVDEVRNPPPERPRLEPAEWDVVVKAIDYFDTVLEDESRHAVRAASERAWQKLRARRDAGDL